MKLSANISKDWLLHHAAPLWSTVGVDDVNGGFYDAIGQDGAPLAVPKRCRTIARQIYSFALLSQLQPGGPWPRLVKSGCDFLVDRYRTRQGEYRNSVDIQGRPHDEGCFNYELAFVLLALAHAAHVLENRALEDLAFEIYDFLARGRAHPAGGYIEGTDQAYLLANPHMHLFEAALAWREISNAPCWKLMSDSLGTNCLDRMIDRENGTICEHYNRQWEPASFGVAPLVEPGHQFEWAWLLLRWAVLTGESSRVEPAVTRLYQFGMTFGVDPERGVAVAGLSPSGAVQDPSARLWAQAEWLKAALALAKAPWQLRRQSLEEDAARAWAGLSRYLETAIPGLWFDILKEDNSFVDEPARASSLYHIVGAIDALTEYADQAAAHAGQ